MRSYRLIAQLLISLLCLGFASVAGSTAIEKILMPGEVSQAHAKYESDCKQCHDRSRQTRQSTLCLSCHKDIASDLRDKRGFHGNAVKSDTECTACHNEHKGRAADIVRFDRESFEHAISGYKLEGRHRTVACASCHAVGKKFRAAQTTCFGCHEKQDIHQGKLGKDCAQCHTQISFKKTDFDHSKTHFALKDAHARAACSDCHRDPSYKNTPMECVACHARDDSHKGGRGPACGACHNTDKWKTAVYDHAKLAHFALNGAHAKIACDTCHRSGDTKAKIPDQCSGCHAANDRHGGRFGDDCKQCHTEESWKNARYDHEKQAHWELKGKHAKVDCHACLKQLNQQEG